MNKLFKITALIAVASSFSHSSFAKTSAQLELQGIAGGNCGIEVIANSSATNLDLSAPSQVNVGNMEVNCDFNFSVSASSANHEPGGNAVLMHGDGNQWTGFDLNVNGINVPIATWDVNNSFISHAPGIHNMPIDVNPHGGAAPGIYSNTITFTLKAD